MTPAILRRLRRGPRVRTAPTIRRRLAIGFGASIVPILGAAVVGSAALRRAHDELRERTREVIEVKDHLFASEAATRQYVVLAQGELLDDSGTGSAKLDSVSMVADSLRRWLSTATSFGEGERARLARIGVLQARAGTRLALARAEIDIERREAALQQVAHAEPLLDSLFAESRAITATEDAEAAAMLGRAERVVARQELLLRTLLAIGSIVAIVFGMLTWRAVSRPLGRLTDVARRIGAGDLTVSAEPAGLDEEYRVLAVAFNEATARLSTIVRALQEEAASIDSAAAALAENAAASASVTGDVSATIAQVASASAVQLRAVDASTEVLESVTASAATLDDVAARARALEAQIGELAGTAQGAVAEAVDALGSARDVIGTSAANVHRVEEASSVISRFVETIDRIASQTSLVALNASIEAARASEHGRGFAVVADEVRKLAAASTRAAQEVRGVVESIRTETATAVSAFDDGARRLGDVNEISQSATEALAAIRTMVASIDALTDAVSDAAQASRSSIETLGAQMASVSEQAQSQAAASEQASAGAQESAASSEEVGATASQLAESANRLVELAAVFKV